jgi:Beta-glucanase/Beta-glucan synthetase
MKKISILLLLTGGFAFGQAKKGKLLWEETFDGDKLNDKTWNYELGDGCPNVCGWGNNERQIYTTENHKIADGKLVITVKKEGDKYTSTRITTAGKKEFKYGYMEARAKLPVGQGIWPAFWMLGSNIKQVGWPKSGEIDILEYVGKRTAHGFHFASHARQPRKYGQHNKTRFPNIEEGFHTYAADWTKDKIDFLC